MLHFETISGVEALSWCALQYFSSEAKFTLDVVDTGSMEIISEIPLSGRPNNISIGKDGRYVYVGIMQDPGGVDVIDTVALENVRQIDTGSRVHNTYVTPDGLYLITSTFTGEHNLGVYSTETDELVFNLYPPRDDTTLEGVRPDAIETREDGSTSRNGIEINPIQSSTPQDKKRVAKATL